MDESPETTRCCDCNGNPSSGDPIDRTENNHLFKSQNNHDIQLFDAPAMIIQMKSFSPRGLFEKKSTLIFPLFFGSRRAVIGHDKKIDQSERINFQKNSGKISVEFV